MKTRTLGNGGPVVSAIGLGCMSMSGLYGRIDEAEAIATIRRAPDVGINLIDTSDFYGNGRNEQIVGEAIRGSRDRYVLCSKFGNLRRDDGSPYADGRPEYVTEACERSLKRLGVEAIDLYYQHRVDDTVPSEDTVGAMARLVEQGKIRHVGLSEASAETIRRAHAVHPVAALQTEYSLWTRDAEAEWLPTTRELGITYVAYSPLGRSFLTGTVGAPLPDGDGRQRQPRFVAPHVAHNRTLLEPLRAVAESAGASLAQVALAWILARGDDIIPLPSSDSLGYLESNAAAADLSLNPDQLMALDAAFPPGAAAGGRLSPGGLKMVNR